MGKKLDSGEILQRPLPHEQEEYLNEIVAKPRQSEEFYNSFLVILNKLNKLNSVAFHAYYLETA